MARPKLPEDEKAVRDPIKQSEYNRQYYERNKERIQARKKKRYHNDAGVKEAYITRAVERKRRLSKEKAALKRMGKLPLKREWAEYNVQHNGRWFVVEMTTAGILARMFSRSIQTLRIWESRCILPKCVWRSPASDRLYTRLQVEGLMKIYKDQIRKYGKHIVNTRIGSTEFSSRAHELWVQYPLGFDLSKVRKEV